MSAEADELLLYDAGADTYFLRRFTRDGTGALTGTTDVELDGSTAYVATGPVEPTGLDTAAGPNVVVTYTRATNTTVNVAAGALAVHYLVIADAVTVEGVAVPTGVPVTHEVKGYTTDALTIVADATGDVLVIEERAA